MKMPRHVIIFNRWEVYNVNRIGYSPGHGKKQNNPERER